MKDKSSRGGRCGGRENRATNRHTDRAWLSSPSPRGREGQRDKPRTHTSPLLQAAPEQCPQNTHTHTRTHTHHCVQPASRRVTPPRNLSGPHGLCLVLTAVPPMDGAHHRPTQSLPLSPAQPCCGSCSPEPGSVPTAPCHCPVHPAGRGEGMHGFSPGAASSGRLCIVTLRWVGGDGAAPRSPAPHLGAEVSVLVLPRSVVKTNGSSFLQRPCAFSIPTPTRGDDPGSPGYSTSVPTQSWQQTTEGTRQRVTQTDRRQRYILFLGAPGPWCCRIGQSPERGAWEGC